jgi:RES domain
VRARRADRPLYRIGRAPNPWAWPDWLRAATDRTFGNRFDDPQGDYRVLYAGSSALGAFVEVLARFRPDPHVAAELARISGDAKGALPPGHLDAAWLGVRRIGTATVAGRFAEIGHSESLAELERALAARLAHYEIATLDASAIRLSAPRRFTQEISRYVYELTAARGRRAFDGIAYLSKLGDEFRNWAIFEPIGRSAPRRLLTGIRVAKIARDDAALRDALDLLGIRLS